MSDTSSIRPWFKMDLGILLKALYFAMKVSSRNIPPAQWRGTLDGYAAVALAIGINPESFMTKEDIEFMKMEARR